MRLFLLSANAPGSCSSGSIADTVASSAPSLYPSLDDDDGVFSFPYNDIKFYQPLCYSKLHFRSHLSAAPLFDIKLWMSSLSRSTIRQVTQRHEASLSTSDGPREIF